MTDNQTETPAEAAPARCVIELTGGLIPGAPDPELTRRWTITADQWDDDNGPMLLLSTYSTAFAYSLTLTDPARCNWTQLVWIWL